MERVNLKIEMELISDTILGSGYSIPGGHDIAFNKDRDGFPYLKGTAFKGLLRENVENWLVWTGRDESVLNLLFGESGWSNAGGERRVRVESLCLKEFPKDVKTCFSERVFTSLNEFGVSANGTLRTSECIKKGLIFKGSVVCAKCDEELIKNAISCIKWIGTLRSRGFGKVRFSVAAEDIVNNEVREEGVEAKYIHYRIRNEAPVIITHLSKSGDNNYETRDYIPGSAIRGMVIESIISDDSEYFEHNKIKLLSDDIRFLNAFPNPEPDKLAALPSIKGFYEDKNGSNFTSVIVNSDFKPGLKRAKLGSFCAVDNYGNIKYWNADTDGVMRIKRNIDEDSLPFRTRCLSPGQVFDGFIVLKDASMASAIMKAFNKTLWIGADRYEGFGKCIVEKCESVDIMPVEKEYGFSVKRPVKSDSICMLAVSAFTMLNCKGEPCGIDTEELAEKLGAGSVEIESCSTSVSEYGSYNRTWGCRTSAVKMYDQGSIFKLKLDKVLSDTAGIEKIQKEGLGIRKNEGFGQVVFFDPSLLENLKKKSLKDANREWRASDASLARRAKYNWVMKSSEEFDFGNI